MVDETRQVATVAQLQELNTRVEERLKAVEEKETPDIASLMSGVQLAISAQIAKGLADIQGAQPKVDVAAILQAVAAQGAQLADLITITSMLAQAMSATVERTGIAQLSDGTQVSIQITDRKTQ